MILEYFRQEESALMNIGNPNASEPRKVKHS